MSKLAGQPSDFVARLLLVVADAPAGAAVAGEFSSCLATPPASIEVPDGRAAVEALRGDVFDIVVMDLPSLGDLACPGEEAVGRLVRLAQGALTIAISEGASVSAAVGVMRAGAHDFMSRPFAPGALALRFAQLARRHGKSHLLHADIAPEDATDLADATGRLRAVGDLLGWRGDLQQLHLIVRHLTAGFDGNPPPPAGAVEAPAPVLPMWRQEQRIIEAAIASFSGNVALAAAALELSPSTIYRKRQAWAEMEARKGAA